MEDSKRRPRKASAVQTKKPAKKEVDADYKTELQLLSDDELVFLAQRVSEELEKREQNGEG
jgi:hypothetical protein